MHGLIPNRNILPPKPQTRRTGAQEAPDVCLSGFRVLANFHRAFGACFLKDLHKQFILPDHSRKYLLYHLAVWFVFDGIVILVCTFFREVFATVRRKTAFDLSLWFILICSTSIEAYLNAHLMRIQAANWVKVLTKCRLIERDIHVTSSMARRMRISAIEILGLQCLVISFNLVINCLNDFGTGITKMGGDKFNFTAIQRILALTCSFYNGFMIPANSTITRVWMIYFCRLFSVYLQHIHETLKDVLENPGITAEEKITVCDKMRVALNQVRELSASVSHIIGAAILYGYGHSIPLLCLASYFVALDGVTDVVRAYFITFGVAHMLSILIPTILASIVVKEIRCLLHTLGSTRFSGSVLSNHLTLLARVVNEEDFTVKAKGFFQVSLPMFTSVTGAVVVNTVMLLQMKDQLFEKIIDFKILSLYANYSRT